jgi:hypothetical protein
MTIEIPLSKTGKKYAGLHIVVVDDCDSDLSQLHWQPKYNTDSQVYAVRHPSNDNRHKIMHRMIFERVLGRVLERGELVDHINRNTLDNRRENLRLATQSQNQANRGKPSNNTSGYKGVRWHKTAKKWVAQIKFKKLYFYLGSFDKPEEAYAAYCAKAKELYGEFANLG